MGPVVAEVVVISDTFRLQQERLVIETLECLLGLESIFLCLGRSRLGFDFFLVVAAVVDVRFSRSGVHQS